MEQPGIGPVVVGVDGSAEAAAAVAWAAEEAGRRGAPLQLVHALSWPRGGLVLPVSGADLPTLLREGAEVLLRTAAEAPRAVLGAERVGWAVHDGGPVESLHAAAAGAQLVVVGSRGAGGVAGLLMGSTATGVVSGAPCPVVVLPDETTARVRGRRSVVVGVEGRDGDEEVLAVAVAAAAARGTDLVAVHAWQDSALEPAFRTVGPLVDWTGVHAEEERILAESLAGWPEKHPDVEIREAVVRERPARALVAVGLTAELLVVGHRTRRLARLGSTTHGVLHRSGCPVAVVPLPDGTR